MKLYDLTVNHLVDPLGIDTDPYFGWKIRSGKPGTMQTARQIVITDGDGTVVWDSGKVADDRNAFVPCDIALAPRMSYLWTVTVWDNHGERAAGSASFETALGAEEWKAAWMGVDRPEPGRKKGFGNQPPATLFRRAFSLPRKILSARLYATCRGVYRLTVNGARPDDREFAPEHTSYRGYQCYQTYDVTALLRPGENVIGMEVGDGWYCCPQTKPPVDDLTDWRYEGVLYRREEAPYNEDGERALYAPDAAQGPDGRYYLYYALNGLSVISVAVCDTPAGKFTYYGDVHYPDGTRLGEREGDEFQFDPAVYNEGETTWLYSGFCPAAVVFRTGAKAIRLGPDMLTVTQAPVTVVPSPAHAAGTGFEGHAFFEGSSMRKVNVKYYFIYSSELSHELCYAVSDHPDRNFTYGGTIISGGDIGLPGVEKPHAFLGNNHGSIEQIAGKWYVFYHRQTNSSSYSRQGCIEPVDILPDGSIPQVPVTSCGPTGGPLPGEGEYPAWAACHLYLTQPPAVNADAGQNPFPRITQETADVGPEEAEDTSYIANLTPGVMIGFKSFDCKGVRRISVKVRGQCYAGGLTVYTDPDGEPLGTVPANSSNEWHWDTAEIAVPDGVHDQYFKVSGFGIFSLAAFRLEREEA